MLETSLSHEDSELSLLIPRKYDIIIFNFPHAGFGFGPEHQRSYITLHQEVVGGFLKSAKNMVKHVDGEVHVTHKTAYPFSVWNIETLAEEKGLRLIGEMEINKFCFPDYSNKRGSGRHFPVGKSSTFIFKKRLIK